MYTTVQADGTWSADAPVLGLYHLSAKPTLWILSEFETSRIRIGRAGDIRILDDPALARTQCILQIERDMAYLSHSYSAKNPTTVNGVQPPEGFMPIQPGYMIRAGNTTLLALGPYPDASPVRISATNRYELCEAALAWYGSVNAAAKALMIDRKTLDRHLKRSATGAALLNVRERFGRVVKRLRGVGVVPK